MILALICVLACVVFVLVVQTLSDKAKQASPLTKDTAEIMSRNLSSGSESGIRAAIAMPDNQKLSSEALQQITLMGQVTFDTSTFHDNHDGTATIIAYTGKTKSDQGKKWSIVLLNTNGSWKISTTEEIQ